MTAALAFGIANPVALLCWIVLLVVPRARWAAGLVTGFVVPFLLALAYAGIIAVRIPHSSGGFGSLEQVRQLFADDWLLLAGWIHYLAFDLFVGSWEARDCFRRGLSPWLVRPCLLLTFLFGPAGLLLWLVLRHFASFGKATQMPAAD